MSGINGNAELVMPALRMADATPAEAFFGVGESFVDGVRALSVAEPIPGPALALLAGQAAENLLKAFLASAGLSVPDLRQPGFRHNLLALWAEAVNRGLSLTTPPPDWVAHLDRLHNAPYTVRYPMGFNAIVLPNAGVLRDRLRDLVTTVRTAIR
jgi:hypothetical protein